MTGKLEQYSRDEIHELIRQHGGRAASSVSKSTDYLIAGEKAGSKLAKAEKLGVAVISEGEFLGMIGLGVSSSDFLFHEDHLEKIFRCDKSQLRLLIHDIP